ncbi:MAG: aminotransferase class I/II-fold pyridoxal phosphate-dependent enzyme [Pirellulales bacterium]|nr:aminotransferase class I/II-fold pyridoxal phosphate-dependent enzyme [Pirellulales bacterium]
MSHPWIADRMRLFDSSGIRKVFDLAAQLKDPINLSIGQPDFDVPASVQQAAVDAIHSRKNGYALTQGMPVLREKLQALVDAEHGHADRKVAVTSGTSGALVLALWSLVNPGDEVIVFDPYFVMYPPLVSMVGGATVLVDTYPDFRIDIDRLRAALSPRTKVILFNSPANPTGAMASAAEARAVAELAAERGIALVSDEIYRTFAYDEPLASPAKWNPDTIVVDGFSKSHAMTGWRVGFMHGPATVIDEMVKLQQYTFVCAPQPAQWAAAAALDVPMDEHRDAFRRKRDLIYEGLRGMFEVVKPGGAFYVFPKAPWGTATAFVERAVRDGVLVIPGGIFSARDTHFRISYAADERTLERGIEALCRLARAGA